jgi:hypothetical protein
VTTTSDISIFSESGSISVRRSCFCVYNKVQNEQRPRPQFVYTVNYYRKMAVRSSDLRVQCRAIYLQTISDRRRYHDVFVRKLSSTRYLVLLHTNEAVKVTKTKTAWCYFGIYIYISLETKEERCSISL